MPDTLQERDGDSAFFHLHEREEIGKKNYGYFWKIFWKSLKREWNGIDGRSEECELMKK